MKKLLPIILVIVTVLCLTPILASCDPSDESAFSFTLTVNAAKTEQLRWAELIKNNLADIGIDVKIDAKQSADFNSATMNGQGTPGVDFEAAITNYTAAGMNMLAGLGTIYADKHHPMQGGAQVDDEEFAEILAKLNAAATPSEYAQAAQECQQYYARTLPFTALYWDSSVHAIAKKFSGWQADDDFGPFNARSLMSMTASDGDRQLVAGTTYTFDNVGRGNGTYDQLSAALTQQSLVYRAEGEFRPMLADFSVSDDGIRRTFTVKEGMCWEDGTPVTAKDILYTLQYADKYEGKNWFRDITSGGKTTPKLLSGHELSDDGRSITLIYEQADPRALNDFTTLRIMPSEIYQAYEERADAEGSDPVSLATERENLIGCGAYRFEKRDHASSTLTFVKNERYPSDTQAFDKITVRSFNNEDALVRAIEQGEADMNYRYSGGLAKSSIAALEKSGKATLVPLSAGAVATLTFNTSSYPFSNINLRYAVYYAIDYNKFLQLFGSSEAALPHAGFVPPSVTGYYDGTPVSVRDIEKAKTHLEQALKELK